MKTIGIIATWFGGLPDYFNAWMKSAAANKDIDFIIISDQEIGGSSQNIRCVRTTLSAEVKKYETILNRKIRIEDAYKFCDCRLFFGLLYEEELSKYDFWGYCDIDLVFGDIRKFVTDEVLQSYDRVYTYGHLCLYRNNDRMKHIYDLKGGIYSLDEIFIGKAKTTPEEYFGVNRICLKNKIPVYHAIDYADISSAYGKRMNMAHGKTNSRHQCFVWEDGHAYRIYEESGAIKREELVYIHWQKRKPVLDCTPEAFQGKNKFIITHNRLVTDSPKQFTKEILDFYNPVISERQRKALRRSYLAGKIRTFCKSPLSTKRIWFRQLRYRAMGKICQSETYK